jgi:hypothetical protein
LSVTGRSKKSETAESGFREFSVSVLGYREDDEWCALALEMDIRGYGDTFDAALKELIDLVRAQVRFALFKGQPELMWKPAEPYWVELFGQIRRERFQSPAKRQPDPIYRAGNLPLPEPLPDAPVTPFHPAHA